MQEGESSCKRTVEEETLVGQHCSSAHLELVVRQRVERQVHALAAGLRAAAHADHMQHLFRVLRVNCDNVKALNT